MKLESRIGKLHYSDEKIFNYLTSFENIKKLVPEDKVRDWEADEESCRFKVDMIGETGFKIIEKDPFKLIKYSGLEGNKYNFFFWIQLKALAEKETAIKLTIEVELNPMIQMMAKKPLQDFLDKVVDQLEKVGF